MKKVLSLVLAMTPLVLWAQNTVSNRTLVGIVNFENSKLAIFDDAPTQTQFQSRRELVLEENQREGSTELIQILPATGTVKVRIAGESEPRALRLKSQNNPANASFQGLVLEEVGVQTVLQLFGRFSDRTVLQHPCLPVLKFSLVSPATNQAGAAEVLRQALLEKQITVVPDGERFWLVAPATQAPILNPRSSQLSKTGPNGADTELIPEGAIVFLGASIPNVLAIYAEFRGYKLDRSSPLPSSTGDCGNDRLFLRTETALTKEECSYALETVVNWHGLKLVPTENGLAKAVSISPK